MKVGLDGTPLLGQRSGVGHYTGRLLAALLDVGSEHEYLLYSKKALDSLEPDLTGATRINGHLPQSTWLWMQTILPAMIWHSQPDLCHFTNSLAPLQPVKPFVLTIHDASLFVHKEHHPRVRLFYRLLLPVVARRAAAVITISQHARKELMSILRLPADKIKVIYEAAPANFQPVTSPSELAALRQKYCLPEHFLLYIGTIEPRKNISRLLQAIKQIRRCGFPHRLIMAGPPGWLMDDFERTVERLDLRDTVQYIGYVPQTDLPGLYSMAGLFVYPSLYEGFGLPPLEAMACGTPVLSSNCSSLMEVYSNAAYLVNPEDVDEIAAGINYLLTHEAEREQLRCRGLKRVRAFSWEQTAHETLDIYKQVLNGSTNGSN